MPIETTCTQCGATLVVARDVIMVAAGRWRLCDVCRERDEAEAERLLTDERAAQRARPRDWWAASRSVRQRPASNHLSE